MGLFNDSYIFHPKCFKTKASDIRADGHIRLKEVIRDIKLHFMLVQTLVSL